MIDLHALVAQQAALIKAQAAQIEKLTFELATLKNRLFGRSSEAADKLGVQAQLFAPPETIEVEPSPAPTLPRTQKSHEHAKQQPKREILPPGLPREEKLLDLPEASKAGLVKIGEDTSERLAYRPGQHYVLRTVRPRYVDPKKPDAGVQQMPAPANVIPGGILEESVITDMAISKFADHMPLSRQIDRIGRLNVYLSLSTVSENLLTVANVWLKPLVDALWLILKKRTSLHVDETVLPSLPERGSDDRRTQKTRLWTYLNDTGPPIILFHYTDTKAGAHVEQMLANWSASDRVCYLHADAASNYEALYRHQPSIKPVNCWVRSHALPALPAMASNAERLCRRPDRTRAESSMPLPGKVQPASLRTRRSNRLMCCSPTNARGKNSAMLSDKSSGIPRRSRSSSASRHCWITS